MGDKQTVGFIGLGAMGAPMARNVHSAGYPLNIYNRSPERAEVLAQTGVEVFNSPEELTRASDIIIIMVTGPDDLDAVINGPGGVAAGISGGKIVINMSTVSHDATMKADADIKIHGGEFVDAPVSGTVKPAKDGALVILAGGKHSVIEDMTPLLKTMGKMVINCGLLGQGTNMKLMNNLMLAGAMHTLSEGLLFGKKHGLNLRDMLKTIGGGAIAAPMFQSKGAAIGAGNYEKSFPVSLVFKDLNLVLDAAGKAGVPLPQTSTTRESFNAAMAQGLGEEDLCAVFKVLAKSAGMDEEF